MNQLATLISLDSLSIVSRAVLATYRDCLLLSSAPTVPTIRLRLRDHIQRNGLDIMYSDINFDVDDYFIVSILNHNGCCYSHEGAIINDAQNVLNREFFNHK